MATLVIHIEWEGPFSFNDLNKFNDAKIDFGVYQIYGNHPIYGSDILLYIGKAQEETFFMRLYPDREYWQKHCGIYLGRLAGDKTPHNEEWSRQIDLAEKLLIYSHSPAYNSSNIASIPDNALRDVHIFNWFEHRDLLPEVSGGRWTTKFNEIPGYDIYGKHGK
jgi:hypothetical protein